MEGEINNCIAVWITVLASLCYCYTIGMFIPKGTIRFLTIFPIVCLFLWLPLNLTTIHFAGVTSFFISWLGNFKLLLFAFGKGPLSATPPLPLSRFIPMACVPIKLQQSDSETKENPSHQTTKKGRKSVLNYVSKIMLLAVFVKVYDYKEHLHPYIVLFLYCVHIYIMLELLLAMVAAMARTLFQVELEPQFNEPYLATSVQDFWGKRWNLMVSSILRPTVYDPVRSMSMRVMPRRLAALPAVFATFLVSGIMHELIFYYIGRLKPNGEVTCFFLVHGVFLGIEIVIKKALNRKYWLPPMVSGPLALAFVLLTVFWLFLPPFLRFSPDRMGCTESVAFIEFVVHRRFVSPNDVSCPFL